VISASDSRFPWETLQLPRKRGGSARARGKRSVFLERSVMLQYISITTNYAKRAYIKNKGKEGRDETHPH
jgi:hypothetical protein